MIIQDLAQIGSPVLRKVCEETKTGDKETSAIITNLVDTLKAGRLVGISAPQIGSNKRIFVTEFTENPAIKNAFIDELRVFINPKITWSSKEEVEIYEGCGSVIKGQIFGPVLRPEKIKINALDGEGKEFEMEAEGYLARTLQHEVDHLDGILFTDKVKDNTKLISRNAYFKMMKAEEIK